MLAGQVVARAVPMAAGLNGARGEGGAGGAADVQAISHLGES